MSRLLHPVIFLYFLIGDSPVASVTLLHHQQSMLKGLNADYEFLMTSSFIEIL
jgi:hypothetical protein